MRRAETAKRSQPEIGLSLPVSARGRRRPKSARRVRLGIIGAGWWSTTCYMPQLRNFPEVELVSVCGLDEAVLHRCRKKFGFTHVTVDYRELLEQKLDGVIVASPHRLHAEHALAALKAGCHVMVEKPMTTDASSARRLVKAAHRMRRHLVVPCGWQYRPIGVEAHMIVEAGRLGRIEYAVCHMASPLRNLFSGTSFDFKKGSFVDANLSTWSDPQQSRGGYGQGQLPHAIGLLLWISGLKPASVFARTSAPGSKVDLYDSISVGCVGGAISTISGAATLPMGTPGTFQLDIRIFGERGMLHLDVARDHLSWHDNRGRHVTLPMRAGDGSYQCDGPPRQFVDLILGRTRANNSPGEVAQHAVEILDAAYRSAHNGRNVRIST